MKNSLGVTLRSDRGLAKVGIRSVVEPNESNAWEQGGRDPRVDRGRLAKSRLKVVNRTKPRSTSSEKRARQRRQVCVSISAFFSILCRGRRPPVFRQQDATLESTGVRPLTA